MFLSCSYLAKFKKCNELFRVEFYIYCMIYIYISKVKSVRRNVERNSNAYCIYHVIGIGINVFSSRVSSVSSYHDALRVLEKVFHLTNVTDSKFALMQESLVFLVCILNCRLWISHALWPSSSFG